MPNTTLTTSNRHLNSEEATLKPAMPHEWEEDNHYAPSAKATEMGAIPWWVARASQQQYTTEQLEGGRK